MSKIKYMMTSLFIFFTATSIVGAATCGYEEQAKLNNEIGKVVVNYEIKEAVVPDAPIPDAIIGTEEADNYVATTEIIQVNILNITENIYVEVANDYNDDILIFNYNDTVDGVVSFDWIDVDTVVNLTVTIKASDKTGCANSELWIIKKTLPRYNDYSDYSVCTIVPDYYLCQRYVTFSKIDFFDFWDKVNREVEKTETLEEEKNKSWWDKTIDFLDKYKVIFITGGVILVGTTSIILVTKKVRRDSK